MNDIAVVDVVSGEIKHREGVAKILASKFPELKGLTWEMFLRKLPLNLDFVTASSMFEQLNKDKKI